MTVIAHAPVPTSSRLIDADTINLTAVRRPSVEDAQLVDLAARRDPAGVHQLAEAIRTGCPPWCSEDHRGQVTEVDGWSLGLAHERILAELPAQDPAWTNQAATATVLVESTTDGGQVVTEPRVVLSVAEGPEGHYPGSENVQGWSGTPAEVRALAAALLAAAALLDGGAA
ncbi:DUF6907 domain-containing protein [Micromonospora globbae]|uniref:DUF6907 domain-containing protein n=1 Tax=Micromonospora globbae TaxID=1894969 RepID=UPI0034349580